MADVASGCEYETIDSSPDPPDRPQFVFWDEPDPPTSRNTSSQECWGIGGAIPGSSTNPQVAPITQSTIGTAPTASALVHPLGGKNPPLHGPKPWLHLVNLVKTRRPSSMIIPPFSALLSRIPSRIPLEPHITLLLLGAERFQLSDVAMEELNMKLYVPRFYQLRVGLTLTF